MAANFRWILLFALALTATDLARASENVTNNESDNSEVKPFSCKWKDLKFPITYGPAIGCSICVMIGVVQIIFGQKYQKTTLFLVGFSGGALFTYLICVIRSTLLVSYILLITAAVAIFLGILCTTIVFCGLFATGLGAGICLSFAILLAFSSLYEYETLSIPVGVVLGAAVLMAGATVWWKRVFLIISTSVYGGALIMGPIDYFAEDFWLLDYIWRKVFLVQYGGKPCFFSWIILGVWPLMAIIGLLVQFLKTAKKPRKRKKVHRRNNRYARGSPFYSAPEDVEMRELMHESSAPPQPSAPLEDEVIIIEDGTNGDEQHLQPIAEQHHVEQYLLEHDNSR